MKMFGLIDCNNFFVSCERVINPAIAQCPVVVLSNGDGCAVAMSNEAKALGIRRGVPIYQVRDIIRRHNVITISGNHRLYGNISSRVMATIESMIDDVEVYSIDEAFLHIPDDSIEAQVDMGREIVKRVRRWTGIPTSLGIAPTRTLAKVAARFAKKYPGYRSVCAIDTDDKRRKALALTKVEEVWGVGRKVGRKLRQYGIDTALQFADLPKEEIDRMLTLPGQRTWMELNGTDCIPSDANNASHKQICCSRSFSPSVTDLEELRSAIASYVAIASRKLRKQNSFALSIGVFIRTNEFRTDMPQYSNSAFRKLEEPANDLMVLTSEAEAALESIFRQGLLYRKAGVLISEIVDADRMQPGLFLSPEVRAKRRRLMRLVDTINAKPSTHEKINIALADSKSKSPQQPTADGQISKTPVPHPSNIHFASNHII